MIPDEIKSSPTVEVFKDKIKKWWPTDCDCHICRTYISKIGYVNILNQWEVNTWKFAVGIYIGDWKASRVRFGHSTWSSSFRGCGSGPHLGSQFDSECGSVRLARFWALNPHVTTQSWNKITEKFLYSVCFCLFILLSKLFKYLKEW